MRTIVSVIAGVLLAAAIPAQAAEAFKVEVTGKGRPIILIPGLASSGEVWQDTVRHLCGPNQCHVLTLAGFAGQPAIGEPLLPAVEQQLAGYIERNKLGKPVVIGHSLGGVLGLKLAANHPDKVGKLVVVDAVPALGATQAPNATPEQFRQMGEMTRQRIAQQDDAAYAANQQRSLATMMAAPADIARAADWGMRSDRKTVAAAAGEIMATDLRQDIARIQAPTLVLGTWVAYKDYAPRSVIEQSFRSQYAQLPGVQIALAERARHFIMFDEPAWMYDHIDQFLK